MVKHWIELQDPPYNLYLHTNRPRISAEVMRKLVEMKNEMLGIKRSLFEEAVIAEEKQAEVDFYGVL